MNIAKPKCRYPLLSVKLPDDPDAFVKKKLIDTYCVEPNNLNTMIRKIKDTEYILKYMDIKNIFEIYKKFEQEIASINIKYNLIDDKDRQVIEIIEPLKLKGRKFYKSTGKSRDPNLANIWFPFITKQSGRYQKLEDKYLNAIDYLKAQIQSNEENDNIIREILTTDSLLNYGRFINYENALISYYLFLNYDRENPIMTGGKKSSKKINKKSSKKINKKSSKKINKKSNKINKKSNKIK